MTKLEVFADFFQGYRAFMRQPRDSCLGDLSRFLNRFKSDLPALQKRMREEERLNASRFNLFQALGIERKEKLLHTQLLAHFLNPEAAHGQGFVFLHNFLIAAQSHEGFIAPIEPLEAFQWRVRPEVSVGEGNIIDLFIECPHQRYILVIENKIDAGEQHEQLLRYNRWMEVRRRNYKTRQLIFLTPEGRLPRSSGDSSYICMSYMEDIRKCLKCSLEGILAVPVREVVRQYLAVVENLIGDTENEQPE